MGTISLVTPSSSAPTAITQPDPNGDVMLYVGFADSSTPIRACAKVLGLASPVFKAMLSPRFAEGQGSASACCPRTLNLPEDDPGMMLLICQKLHFHSEQTKTSFDLQSLSKLALLCDKYDLARGLESWLETLVQRAKLSVEGYADWAQLLRCSQIFRSHDGFYCSSLRLLEICRISAEIDDFGYKLDVKQVEDRSPNDVRFENIPARFFFSISLKSNELLLKAQKEIEKVVQELAFQESDEGLVPIGHYILDLASAGLWPVSDWVMTSTVRSALGKMELFEGCERDEGKMCDRCGELEGKMVRNMVAATVKTKLRGSCLQCFNRGKITTEQGNCCASVSEDCKLRDPKNLSPQ
ncbi:MAG: hypothetical protein Q9164_000876 [Protoblastenia rupestris]